MSVPPLLAIAVQYYYQERDLPPWRQDLLFQDAARMESIDPPRVARYYFELFVPLAERLRGGVELERLILRETTPLFSPLYFPFGDQNFYSLRRQEQLYYTQSKDEEEMLWRLAGFREHGEEYLQEVIRERRQMSPWKDYTRTTLLSGHSIYLCSAEQLLLPLRVKQEVFPFDRGDLPHLLRGNDNPFTGRPLPVRYVKYLRVEADDWRQTLSFYSLEEVLRGLFNLQPWCPLRLSKEYHSSTEPLQPTDSFPGVTPGYNMVPWYPYYTYQKEEDTGRAQLVLDPYRKPYFNIQERWLRDPEILEALADYHDAAATNFRQIPRSLWPRLDSLRFKSNQPTRVYRGLNNYPNAVARGGSFPLSSEKVQSWTTHFCIAQNYASLWGRKGIVVSTILKPTDILIDSRYIASEQLRDTVTLMRKFTGPVIPRPIVFLQAQVEILSEPGTYQVVVESISRHRVADDTSYPVDYVSYRSDLLTDEYPVIN